MLCAAIKRISMCRHNLSIAINRMARYLDFTVKKFSGYVLVRIFLPILVSQFLFPLQGLTFWCFPENVLIFSKIKNMVTLVIRFDTKAMTDGRASQFQRGEEGEGREEQTIL